ncbi:hypothetical protein LGN17_35440 [Burkholderia sp. AU30280]|uniref:DUF7683 domain-containing protein n=1 Tax=Burkholderia sp. AU30280 TaxID=2879628 RepID=UPI001CF253C0|nr:hypothetical protein [Burkholderia sp. AU30280]MCA8277781.1 hypothetical protein [Burkholderia sp. AU30280]
MSEEKVYRYISVFEKNGNAHVMDIAFSSMPDLQLLQKIFLDGADDPMYDEYAIDAYKALQLEPFVKLEFDLKRFEYFLSCDG